MVQPASRGRRVRRALLIITILLLVVVAVPATVPAPARAALNYDFSCNKEFVDVTIKKDGSIDIDYSIEFTNHGQLDGVDIGLPNRHYSAGSAKATIVIGGVAFPPYQIRKSPYVDIGLAVEFTQSVRNLIEGSEPTFTLNLHVTNPHMVYLNELKSGTVGIRFRPTWFDPSFQRGNTGELRERILFPTGFTNQSQAVYLKDQPWGSIQVDNASGRLVATWDWYNAAPGDIKSGRYDVGAGFPAKYVDKYYKHDIWDKLSDVLWSAGQLCISALPCVIIVAIITVVAGVALYKGKKRQMDYFEPEMSVEGAGPRRDLTAVEAAIVLERPLAMVATMILFGLVKKGKVEVLSDQMPMHLRKLADKGELDYETRYMGAIRADGTVDSGLLRDGLVELIKSVEGKLKGFDFDQTKAYYEAICERAWQQVKAAGTPEDFAAGLDKNNDWMMLDRRYARRMNAIILPFPYVISRTAGPAGTGPSVNPRAMAQNYVSNLRHSSSNMVTSMRGLSRDVAGVTNPVPVAVAGAALGRGLGGGGGFGGGGGCACACACACAGGGR